MRKDPVEFDLVGCSGRRSERLNLPKNRTRKCFKITGILDENYFFTSLINSLLSSRTASILIIISHRLRSVASFERIVVLGAGRVVDAGTHQILYQDCPLYRTLWTSDHQLTVN